MIGGGAVSASMGGGNSSEATTGRRASAAFVLDARASGLADTGPTLEQSGRPHFAPASLSFVSCAYEAC
eukprot:1968800-Pleurochrysis_carterae.AAC.1